MGKPNLVFPSLLICENQKVFHPFMFHIFMALYTAPINNQLE